MDATIYDPDSVQHLLSRAENVEMHSQDINSLLKAVRLYRSALDLQSPDHINHTTTIARLGIALRRSYEHNHQIEALDEAIALDRLVLEFRPVGHADRVSSLLELCNALILYFWYMGDIDIISEVVGLRREVLRLYTPGDSHYGTHQARLGYALHTYFTSSGDRNALEEAISVVQDILRADPQDNDSRSGALYDLARYLSHHLEQVGGTDKLVEEIHQHAQHFGLPKETNEGVIHVHGLTGSFTLTPYPGDNMQSIMQIILLNGESLNLRPRGHWNRASSFRNFAHSLKLYASHTGNKDIFIEAIHVHKEAISLISPSDPFRGDYLNDLALVLCDYGRIDNNNIETLDEAICTYKEALKLFSPHHPTRGTTLNNLAVALEARFSSTADSDVLKEAIDLQNSALEIFCEGHPRRHWSLFSLTRLFLYNSPYFSLEKAFSNLTLANSDTGSLPRQRLRNSVALLFRAKSAMAHIPYEDPRWQMALDACSDTVQLLDRVANFSPDLPTRLRSLLGSEGLCLVGATVALILRHDRLAIEMLEEGRGVFWSRTLQIRNSQLDELPASEREKLVEIFTSLEQRSGIQSTGIDNAFRRLNMQADSMIRDIRSRTGFERFLKAPHFNQLARAAENGPIVFLLTNDLGCFGLILLNTAGDTKSVNFLTTTVDSVQNLSIRMTNSGLRDRGAGTQPDINHSASDRLGINISLPDNSPNAQQQSYAVLAELWHSVVKPIIEALGLEKLQGRTRPRIHWCPTGYFTHLPLHAAGVYSSSGTECAADYIVSSYTPKISALMKARAGFTPIPREKLKALLVAESSAPGLNPLYEVEDEIRSVKALIRSASGTILSGAVSGEMTSSTVRSVLNHLPNTHILHLACHGLHNAGDPLASHFALRDGPLSIASLMELALPSTGATLAFLSACETARGTNDQPDQAVHLAASMLFCGFRSIIATMWTMDDADGPFIAKRVYQELLAHDALMLDDIPYALDAAVQALRETGASPSRWATFIHMGA